MPADYPITPDGDDSFVLGVDGYTSSTKLGPGEYISGLNIVNRGGVARTRPGSASVPFKVPSGRFQGICLFTPSGGIPHLVFAVKGKVYASQSPFRSYFRLEGIQFSEYSPAISWASAVQSTYYDNAGALQWLAAPVNTLMMQDGYGLPAYWDGTTSAHVSSGTSATPQGLWMVWSNNRLWVSRGNQVFASDIGNPLSFTENDYLSELRSFYLTGPCTGICETPDKTGILCFTKDNGSLIQSSIQDRTKWAATAGMQTLALPNVGCVAPRSIVQQYGLLWWWTDKGLISLDAALNANITSRLVIQDNEMAQAKWNLSRNLYGVCGAKGENYLLHGVPNGHSKNTQVHVMDTAPFEGNQNSWNGVWTGWNPVEFASGVIESRDRVFLASEDDDGQNRIWELLRSDRTDNGVPITCYVQTKHHLWGHRDYKRLRFAEIEVRDLNGDASLLVAAAGLKGAYQEIGVNELSAADGQVVYNQQYGSLYGSRPQTRVLRTEDNPGASDCNAGCFENPHTTLVDKAFSLLILWSGDLGISAYRIFAQSYPTDYNGRCNPSEAGQLNLLTASGCQSNSIPSSLEALSTYYAVATATRTTEDNETFSVSCAKSSKISQRDAVAKASAVVSRLVQEKMGEVV